MDTVQRFTNLKQQIETLSAKKIRIDERFSSEKGKLEDLVKEITAKGYDPTKLADIKTAKEAELKKAIDELDALVQDISQKLSSIEA